jgi:hypothetical protein
MKVSGSGMKLGELETSFLSSWKAVESCQRKGLTDHSTIRTAPIRRSNARADPPPDRRARIGPLTRSEAFIVSSADGLYFPRHRNAETESDQHFGKEDGAGKSGSRTELQSRK